MPTLADRKAAARIASAIVGAVLGIVVAFTFGFAKPETVARPIGNPLIGGPSYENVPAGYGVDAFVRVSIAAFVFGAIGWCVGDEAGKHLYPQA